jgi:hypothetical protein
MITPSHNLVDRDIGNEPSFQFCETDTFGMLAVSPPHK